MLIERANRLDGCVSLGGDWYEFAQGNNVAVVNTRAGIGTIKKDRHRADKIRAELKPRDPG